ncbi:DDE-type integrase/transposase/recombinase [Dankookia sp. GCM10030260]|uniref:DDE-type integrase/transposase/recombinase n=1 Tax=Dankookia sp. GCM10030260 TaxID=3273390 RepID=UPI003614814F
MRSLGHPGGRPPEPRVNGQLFYPWRAADQHSVVLDILVQERRSIAAAKRCLRRLLAGLKYKPLQDRRGGAPQLRRCTARGPARHATSGEPSPEQSCREAAWADAPSRTPDATRQGTRARPAVPPRRTR